jgi:hypothetical protein
MLAKSVGGQYTDIFVNFGAWSVVDPYPPSFLVGWIDIRIQVEKMTNRLIKNRKIVLS